MKRMLYLVLVIPCITCQYVINIPNITNTLMDESQYTLDISILFNDTDYSAISPLSLSISSENAHVFNSVNKTLEFSNEEIRNSEKKSFGVVTDVIGVTRVTFLLYDDVGTVKNETVTVVVTRKYQTFDLIFTSVLAILVLIATAFMGCGLDMGVVKQNIVRPRGPIVGFVCQFGFMPLVSLGLGYLFFEDNLLRLGLFIIGCSPGGSSSNFWTILFNGDVNLSITMTFVSSIAAIGMMPLWVYIITPLMDLEKDVVIPYSNLIISVATLTLPLGLGLLLRRFKHNWAEFAANKLVKPVSFIIIIFVLTMGTLNGQYMYKIWTWQVALSGLFLAWAGFAFGALFAWIMRLSRPKVIAISLETALQNGSIGYLALKVSLPSPYSDLAAMPAISALMMTGFSLYFGYAVYIIARKVRDYMDRRNATKRVRLEKPEDNLSLPLNQGYFITAAAGLPPGMPLPGDASPTVFEY